MLVCLSFSFLSSVDSLGRFGVPVNGAENSPDPARSPTPREDLPPPPFPEAEEAAAAADNPGDGFVEADLSAPAASVEEAVIAQPVVPQAAEAAEAAEDLPTTENTASNTSDAEPSSASSASADGAGARQSISVSTTDIAPAPVVEVQPSTPVSGSAQD